MDPGPSSSQPRCQKCKRFLPTADWDSHSLCPNCRPCSLDNRCDVCRSWSVEWDWLVQRTASRGKTPAKGAKKKKKGATAPLDAKSSPGHSGRPRGGARVTARKPAIQSAKKKTGSSRKVPTPAAPTDAQSSPADGDSIVRVGRTATQPTATESSAIGQDPSEITALPDSGFSTNPVADNPLLDPQEDPLFSGLESTVPSSQDFIGFELAGSEMADSSVPAGGHRSRSTVRSRKRKRCHSSSDSSSPSSVRGRSSDKQPDQSETLSQILSLLSQMSQGNKPTQAERPVQTQPQPQAERPVQIRPQLQTERPVQTQSQLQAERPVRIRQPQTERESQFQHPRSVSIQERASPSADTSVASGPARRDSLTSELSPDPDFFSDDNHEVSGSDEDDDPPLFGTDLTRESFDKAVEVVRRQLGFEDVQQPTEDQGRKSKLSLNRPTPDKRPLMPVDVECEDRLKAASTSRKWTPFPRKQTSEFRVDEREWNACFRTPPIPTGAVDHLRNAGAMDAKGRYRSAPSKKSEKALSGMDKAARAGMKFSSALLLVAEVLMKSFRQDVSRRDTGAVVNILGPLSRLIFDQFARIAVRSVQERRDLLLESLSWPTQDIKRRFLDLPLEGKDIFGGRFDEHLQVEVKRRKDLKKADFRLPAAFSRRRSPDFRRSSRPSQPRSSGSSDRRRSDHPFRRRPSIRNDSQVPGRQTPFNRPARDSTRGRGRGRFQKP